MRYDHAQFPMAVLVISYSRTDRIVIRAVVKLLRAALPEIERAVFWDDDIEPGDEWRSVLREEISRAKQLFVFWCAHAAESREVEREWQYAVAQRLRIVPVLLDSTPLAAQLARINGIDLRGVVLHPQHDAGRPSRVGTLEGMDWLDVPEDVGLEDVGLEDVGLEDVDEAPPIVQDQDERERRADEAKNTKDVDFGPFDEQLERRTIFGSPLQERRIVEAFARFLRDPDASGL